MVWGCTGNNIAIGHFRIEDEDEEDQSSLHMNDGKLILITSSN